MGQILQGSARTTKAIPHLTRSSLHRCLQRHDISRLPEIAGDKKPKRKFKTCPIGYFPVDIAKVQTAEGNRRATGCCICCNCEGALCDCDNVMTKA
ncbi:hypothetical protein SAMN02927924_02986 [Sphingobium faniae]|nr:hypothetical protein SAMN02927924_02986 [Sphingobium faniae]